MAYKLEPEQQPEPKLGLESIHRLPAQLLTGAVAQAPGIFGDVGSVVNDYITGPLAQKIQGAVTGQEPTPYEETLLGKILPTTAVHNENINEAIPYLKPKNDIERFFRNIGEDTIGLFAQGPALQKAGLRGTNLVRSFATSLGANIGGEAVKEYTGSKEAGSYTKSGLMFLGSVINKPQAEKEISKLFAVEDKLLPHNDLYNTSGLESNLNNLKNKVLSGRRYSDLAPSEKFLMDEADKFLGQINNGRSNPRTIRAQLRSLNENLEKAVYEAPDKGARTRSRKLAKQINGYVNQSLADYGKQNPEWWKAHRKASEAFGTLKQSEFFTNFIKNNFHGNPITHGLLHALGATVGAAGAIIPYQGLRLLYRIANSKTLAGIYGRIVGSAAVENAPLMNKEIKKLDSVLQKEEKSRKKRPRFRLSE